MVRSEKVTEYLDWVRVLSKSRPEYRRKLVEAVKRALKNFSEKGEGNSDHRAGHQLAATFFDPSQYELVGFAPNVSYVKVDAESQEELEALWVHPWGTTTLLLKHKKLPFVVMINPGIRMGKSFLKEMKESRKYAQNIRGVSG